MPDRIKNSRNVGISTICEMNDFVNSFNEIIDNESNYSTIDGIFVKLFKKANDFDIWHRQFKRSIKNLNRFCLKN